MERKDKPKSKTVRFSDYIEMYQYIAKKAKKKNQQPIPREE